MNGITAQSLCEGEVWRGFLYPPMQEATVFEAVDECVEGALRRSIVAGYASEGSTVEACGGAKGFSLWGSTPLESRRLSDGVYTSPLLSYVFG